MDAVSAFVGSLIGLAFGAVLAWLLTERRARARHAAVDTQRALAQQLNSSLTTQVERARDEATRAGEQAEAARAELSTAQQRIAALESELRSNESNLAAQRKLLDDAQQRLTEAFSAVSVEALAKSNQQFIAMAEARFKTLATESSGTLEQKKAQIETLLKPLQELLRQYQQRLGEIEKSRSEGYGALQKQLGTLGEIERTLAQQTGQLVSALSRPAVRGQWGEIALRKLAELAGMTSRCDFVEQPSVNTDDGRLRPDMLVQLPGDRAVVVDCKAVLGAFLDAAAAADDGARDAALRKHAGNVRARAKDLASKAYWAQFPNTPEFVVLFLPGESFLYAAVEQDTTLIEDCLQSKVILATPTTFIALLKTIEYGWRQEAVSRNAEAIRTLGIEIYDRIAVLAGHMDTLGTSLGKVVHAYNNALRSMETRLLVSARKIGELGAHNDRELPDLSPVDVQPQELGSLLKSERSLLPD